MLTKRQIVSMFALFVLAALTLTGCAGCKPKPVENPKTVIGGGTGEPVRPPDPKAADLKWVKENIKVVYFDFDKSAIRKDMDTVIADNAKALKGRTDIKLTVEGNCDERGTVEYNMALGEKRAKSVRDALIAKGIDGSRLSLITKGKANPVVANAKSEAEHQKNRRAEFIPTY